jgi:hypothetical protein
MRTGRTSMLFKALLVCGVMSATSASAFPIMPSPALPDLPAILSLYRLPLYQLFVDDRASLQYTNPDKYYFLSRLVEINTIAQALSSYMSNLTSEELALLTAYLQMKMK